MSQDPPICVHASLSQDGFYCQRPMGSLASVGITSLLTSKDMHGQGDLLASRMSNTWSGQGLAASLKRPASLILEFQSSENESPITLPRGLPIYLLPQNGQETIVQ